MEFKLNWKLQKNPNLGKILQVFVLIFSILFLYKNATAQDGDTTNVIDTIVAKTNKIIHDEDTMPVYSFSVGRVGSTFPCGVAFGISLQAAGYHIFSGESAYNATFVPNSDEILYPESGNKNGLTYKNTFKRVKQLKVGTIEGNFGKRWTISAEQFQENYSNLFDFEQDGQLKNAGDYNNLFFEMLISIQELAKENEALKDRLNLIENDFDLVRPNTSVRIGSNTIKISPNPSKNGILSIQYNIDNKVAEAIFYIYDLTGRELHRLTIEDRGTGGRTKVFDLAAGAYLYQLVTDGNKSEIEKIVIN